MVSHKRNLDNIWICISILRIVPEPSLFWKHIANPKPFDWTMLKRINKVVEKHIGNTIGHNPFDVFSLLGLWNRFNFTDFLAEYADAHTDGDGDGDGDGDLDDGDLDDGNLDDGDGDGDLDEGGLGDGDFDDEKYNRDVEDGLPDDEKYIHDVEVELPEDEDDDFGDDVRDDDDFGNDVGVDDDFGNDVGDLWQDGDLG